MVDHLAEMTRKLRMLRDVGAESELEDRRDCDEDFAEM